MFNFLFYGTIVIVISAIYYFVKFLIWLFTWNQRKEEEERGERKLTERDILIFWGDYIWDEEGQYWRPMRKK